MLMLDVGRTKRKNLEKLILNYISKIWMDIAINKLTTPLYNLFLKFL